MEDNVKSFVKDRGIKYLCHFTPRSNVEKIKSEGLKLRNASQMTVTDASRYDMSENICLTISEPNSWMFKKKQEQGFDLVLLILSPSVLYNKKCFFFPYNAATKSFRGLDKFYLSSKDALEYMFSEKITFKKSQEEERTIHRKNNISNFMPTSNQAEVQVAENIDPSYIIAIIESDIPLSYSGINKRVCDLAELNTTPRIDPTSRKTKPLMDAIMADIDKKLKSPTETRARNENKKEKQIESIIYNTKSEVKKATPQKRVPAENSGSNYGCLIIFAIALMIYLLSR